MSTFKLGQYHHIKGESSPDCLTYITGGNADIRTSDYDTDPQVSLAVNFRNSCLHLTSNLVSQESYYLHVKIKRTNLNQAFKVKLVQYGQSSLNGNSQYIRTFNVSAGSGSYEVDFIFTALKDNFDCILFELQRERYDDLRIPSIAYIELSEVKNFQLSMTGESAIDENNGIVKLGVQARPGFMMCINKEEIHISRSGVYELRNGILPITFFSLVCGATENSQVLVNQENNPDAESICLIGSESTKTRVYDNVSVDYIYQLSN